eukprot:TRINITY_DN9689_c0_g1_i1.p1 TRINITY_DN9689_c0_g1~~TRINITY_DN9689_c0_g1_i1.p1  ORF type:complete len:357 (+),score=67.95 TRINITY_DN9689_c0_g1_i1:180-1250(+)
MCIRDRYIIKCKPEDNIGQLKLKLVNEYNENPENIKLCFRGAQLNNEQTIQSLSIQRIEKIMWMNEQLFVQKQQEELPSRPAAATNNQKEIQQEQKNSQIQEEVKNQESNQSIKPVINQQKQENSLELNENELSQTIFQDKPLRPTQNENQQPLSFQPEKPLQQQQDFQNQNLQQPPQSYQTPQQFSYNNDKNIEEYNQLFSSKTNTQTQNSTQNSTGLFPANKYFQENQIYPNQQSHQGPIGPTEWTLEECKKFPAIQNLLQSESPQILMDKLKQLMNTDPQQASYISLNFEKIQQLYYQLHQPTQKPGVINITPEQGQKINQLMELGFSQQDAAEALFACEEDVDKAANILFSQ